MLRAGVFSEFKGSTTLLLWGDKEGMAGLLADLLRLQEGTEAEFAIGGGTCLIIASASSEWSWSRLAKDESGFRWFCSNDILEQAVQSIEPLLCGAGHQFLDVSGLAQQVIISRDEYPPDLR